MSKRLILVRHAHRDKTRGRELDNGLSKKGWQQEARFRKEWKKKLRGKTVAFVSSPKIRCVETVAPLAAALDHEVEILALLDEQGKKESELQFHGRVIKFLTWWKKQETDYVVASTHGDWMPEFLSLSGSEREEVAKGDWRLIKSE